MREIDEEVRKDGFYFAYPTCHNCYYQGTELIPLGSIEKDYFNGLKPCPRCSCSTFPARQSQEEEER